MRPTRWRDLAIALVAAAAVAYVVTRGTYANLPSPTVYSLLWIALLTIAEVYTALITRARLVGRTGTRSINPLLVARIAALAKASSVVGSLAIGGYLGFGGYVIQQSSAAATRDTHTSLIGVGLGVLLVAAARFLEHVCRVPPEAPDDDFSR
jgi:hypothetical protein